RRAAFGAMSARDVEQSDRCRERRADEFSSMHGPYLLGIQIAPFQGSLLFLMHMLVPPSLAVGTGRRHFLPYSPGRLPAPVSSPSMRAASRPRSRPKPHRVVMLGFAQAQVLDITGPLEVFSRTARWLAEHRGTRVPAYATELVAARAGPLAMSNGLELVASRRYADVNDADTLLVGGGIGWEAAATDRTLLDWLAVQARRVDRLGSICNGAMLLAAAGLL